MCLLDVIHCGKKVFDGCLRIAPKKYTIFLTESHSDSGGGGVFGEGFFDWDYWAYLFC